LLSRLIYFRFSLSIIIYAAIIHQANCQILLDLKKEFEKAKDYKEAILVFQQYLGNHTAIFSGKSYSFNYKNIDGHPFLLSENWKTGDIYIYDKIFYDTEIKLDIYNDVLLIRDTAHNNQSIILNDNLIKGFVFFERYFINIRPEEFDIPQIKEGFYELVYHEKSTVLIKHHKDIETKYKFGTDLNEEFVSSTNYYIICQGIASIVNSKKALIKALSKHNKEIKRFIKDNRIKYADQKLENIVKIVRFYDSLDS